MIINIEARNKTIYNLWRFGDSFRSVCRFEFKNTDFYKREER